MPKIICIPARPPQKTLSWKLLLVQDRARQIPFLRSAVSSSAWSRESSSLREPSELVPDFWNSYIKSYIKVTQENEAYTLSDFSWLQLSQIANTAFVRHLFVSAVRTLKNFTSLQLGLFLCLSSQLCSPMWPILF